MKKLFKIFAAFVLLVVWGCIFGYCSQERKLSDKTSAIIATSVVGLLVLQHVISKKKKQKKLKAASDAEYDFEMSVEAVGDSFAKYKTNPADFPKTKDCIFYDIETTGLKDAMLTIAVWLENGKFNTYIAGEDKKDKLKKAMTCGKDVVTFYGTKFDLPITKRCLAIFDEIKSLDMIYAYRSHGIQGGLKVIAESLGIKRPAEMKDTTGREAVEMWKGYQATKNDAILKNLIYYCAWDVYMTYMLFCEITKTKPDSNIRAELDAMQPPPLPDRDAVPEDLLPTGKNLNIAGKVFTFSGGFTMRYMSQEAGKKLIELHGGKCLATCSVKSKLDYLVKLPYDEDEKTNKIKTVQSLIEKGADIKTITESDFFALIQGV
jgi:Predicted exonuclease